MDRIVENKWRIMETMEMEEMNQSPEPKERKNQFSNSAADQYRNSLARINESKCPNVGPPIGLVI